MTAVVAVICLGIIAAVFLPVLVYSGPSWRGRCISNVKQLEIGVILYAGDNEDTAPGFQWMDPILPYVKNESAFHCLKMKEGGYGLNAYVAEKRLPYEDANLVMLAETPVTGRNAVFAQLDPIPKDRHEGSMAIGFADGHAKVLKPELAAKLRLLPSPPKPKGAAKPEAR